MYFDWRLFGMTRAVRGRILLATIIGLVGVPVAIWRLTLTGQTMAQVFQGGSLASVAGTLLLIAALIVLRAALQFVRDEVANRTAVRMKVWLRHELYERAVALGPGYFDQRRTGDTALTLVDGVEQLDIFFGQYLPQLVVGAVTPLIIFAFMATLDLQIAVILVGFALATLVAPAAFHRLNSSRSLQFRRDHSAMASDFLDNIQGLATLKAFGQSARRGVMLAERARTMQRSTMRVLGANLATGGVTLLGISLGAAVALAWGAVRVESGTLDLRTLLVVLLLGTEVFRPLRDLTTLYHNSMLAMAATRGIFQLLDAPIEIRDPASPPPNNREIAPTVRFERVTFGYQGGRRPALHDCSFEVAAGETLGIVGPSGAGKSTLVNLILRLADPQQGRVLVGGRDVRELPLDVLRRTVALVAQDTYLFYGTVADNLRLGKPNATQAELEEAARTANAHEFIAALPAGYDTAIGERGTRLSGGQRQRIAIARALLKNAPILVLDEALSSVDAENEATIQEALERLQRGRTTLVIAHRLSSVANADRIAVLEHGHLVETGTNADLLGQPDSVYARLMAAQQPVEQARMADIVIEDGSGDGRDSVHQQPRAPLLAGGGGHAHSHGGGYHQAAVPATDSGKPLPVKEVWGRLLRLVKPWLGETLATLFLGPVHAVAQVILGVLSAMLVGQVATGGDIRPWVSALLSVAFLTALLRYSDSWVAHDLAYRLLAELRIRLYQLLDPLAPAFLQRRRSGDLVSAATGDVELIELFYAHTISPLFVAIVVPVGVLIVLATIAPPLALVLAPFIVAVALTPWVAGARAERLGHTLRDVTGRFNAHAVDSIQGLRTIAAFTHGPARTRELDELGSELGDHKAAFARWQGTQNLLIESLIGLGSLSVLAVGAQLVAMGQITRVQLPVATLLAMSAFQPVVTIVTVAKELMQTLASARRFMAIEDEPVPVSDGPGAKLPDTATRGLPVAFEEVTFSYAPGVRPALDGVSFRVEAGQTVALVGRSGAGKTTAAHLLMRFWDPQHGRISLGGQDVRSFKLDDLRRQVALVAQDTYLFNTSLKENLRLARPEASDAEVLAVAQRANVEEFAIALPDGYETTVGERGMQLSGGQRQRVAIARALLRDAPVLVLDEATSHLDAVNEAEVRAALDELMVGRTVLVIAHRLSTIRHADLIVVLDQGRVAEQGRHADLVALDGLYSHLIAAQLGRSGGARITPELANRAHSH